MLSTLKWSAVPEDILFNFLKIVDEDAANEVCEQTDWIWRNFEPSERGVVHTRKFGVQAVRQVCSNWRSAAMAMKGYYPLWMTTLRLQEWWLHYDLNRDTIHIRGNLLKHFEDADIGIWAELGTHPSLDFLLSAIVSPCHLRLRFARFIVGSHLSKTAALQKRFPRLQSIAYMDSNFTVYLEQTQVNPERLEIFPVSLDILVSA
jgi:hypothetical protein